MPDKKFRQPEFYHAVLSESAKQDIGLAEPNADIEKEVARIYLQARQQRTTLLKFYISYTVAFSWFVGVLVILQVIVRLFDGKETVEIVPQWVLYLLVTGMFAQFISLLTIVTTKVWSFEQFFKHYNELNQKNK